MSQIDDKLAAALKQASRTPMNFAFVAKGSTQGKLVVSRTRLTAKEVAEAKRAAGHGKLFRGRCIGKDGKLVFETAQEPPPTLDNQLRRIIKDQAGLTFKVETRIAPGLLEEPEGLSETEAGAEATLDVHAGDVHEGELAAEGDSSKPATEPDKDAKAEVTRRLTALAGAYTQAIAQKGPDVAQMQTLMASIKASIDKNEYDQAATTLGDLEKLVRKFQAELPQAELRQKVLAKKAETEKKIAFIEKLPHAAHVASQIAVSKQKVVNALALAEAPAHDYAGALAALAGVDAACVTIEKMIEMRQKVLIIKLDTDKKIARLEKHPQKALIAARIAEVTQKRASALALGEAPAHDYMGAINALNAVDKLCATAEVRMLDEAVRGKDRGDMKEIVEKIFKERFGVEVAMRARGDSPTEEYMAMRRVYEMMALVPEAHATNNPSLKHVERNGGPEEVSYYQAQGTTFFGLINVDTKKVVLNCQRPTNTGTTLQAGLKINRRTGQFDPPVEENCKPRDGVSMNQSYFDWTTLHEIAHAIDDRKSFMASRGDKAEYGGWIVYGSDVAPIAHAAAAHFNFNTPEAIKYIKALMQGAASSRPTEKPPAPAGRSDWDAVRQKVEGWVDSVRVGNKPWNGLPQDLNGRIYHEAYGNSWVSYLKASRSQGIKGYQFRAPGEWFSELYAAYNCGVLKDAHPMVAKFLRDL